MTLLAPEEIPDTSRLWRADEFIDWLEPGRHADLINGEIFMHSPVNLRHARLTNFLEHLLSFHIRRNKLGELHRETVAVRLSSRNVFLPDLSYFTPAQIQRMGETIVSFAPTLVVELLSPSSAVRDLGPKFAAYEENGVQEYWAIDPHRGAHRFFLREGEFLAEVFPAKDGTFASATVAGFWLRTAWLNPEALPDEDDCLREISAGLPR